MLRAIHFDHETRCWAGKIDDEISNRHLATKMSATYLKVLEMAP